MIGLDPYILKTSCLKHTSELVSIIETQLRTLEICLNYLNSSSLSQKNLEAEISHVHGKEILIKRSINWFLKPSKRGKPKVNIDSLKDLSNFFIYKNRQTKYNLNLINELKSIIFYFNKHKIIEILREKPARLQALADDFDHTFPVSKKKIIKSETKRFLEFIFNYDEFSKKNSNYPWRAYDLTQFLGTRTCLYCNRNYSLTVVNDEDRITRPELDHFLPKGKTPILALSFYNLIPSCHICNSNLKGKTDFSLATHFHPYLSNFDTQGILFTYQPYNAKAFFGDKKNLKVRLDTTNTGRLTTQIIGNVNTFRLDEVYDKHIDIVEEMLQIQKKTCKKNIKSIYEKILVDSNKKPLAISEKEIYELMVRNFFDSKNYHKKPMAKFERDIAKEIGLIT